MGASALAAPWIDGTYEAWSDAERTGTQYAKVFINDGKISAVIVREFTDRLVEKDWTNYSYPHSEKLLGQLVQNS